MLGVFLLGAAWTSTVLGLTFANVCVNSNFEIWLCVFVTEVLNMHDGGVSSTTWIQVFFLLHPLDWWPTLRQAKHNLFFIIKSMQSWLETFAKSEQSFRWWEPWQKRQNLVKTAKAGLLTDDKYTLGSSLSKFFSKMVARLSLLVPVLSFLVFDLLSFGPVFSFSKKRGLPKTGLLNDQTFVQQNQRYLQFGSRTLLHWGFYLRFPAI